jgi:hypothetical protein
MGCNECRDLQILDELLKAGPQFVPVQLQDEMVQCAVHEDKLSVVRLLYAAGWRLPNAIWGRELLLLAANIDMLEYLLLTVGCDTCGDGGVWGMLQKHCELGKLEHVSLLIWAGADINAKYRHGLTPMAYALHGVSLHPQLMCRYLERCGIDRKQVCPTAEQRACLSKMREDLLKVSSGLHLNGHSHIKTEDCRQCNHTVDVYLYPR